MMDTIDLSHLAESKNPLATLTCSKCHHAGGIISKGGDQAKCMHCGKRYKIVGRGKVKP